MSLIRCPECKRKISDAAEYCPWCGLAADQILKDVKVKKSKRRKNMLWLVIALVILLFVSTSQNNKNEVIKPKTKLSKTSSLSTTKANTPKKSQATTSTHQEGLGVSYTQAIGQLNRYFNLEKRTLASNQTAWTALSQDKTLALEYVGPGTDLSQAYIMIGIPKDNNTILQRNIAIAMEFTGNIFPDWPECGKRTLESMTQVAKTQQSLVQYQDYKKIEIKPIKQFGVITITITKP